MATVPTQYAAGSPTQDNGNLSPLQLALAYYMDIGQIAPFAVNFQFLNALRTFSNSGVIRPSDLNLQNTGAIGVICDGPMVKVIRRAQNCGPLEIERYESIVVGEKADLTPGAWHFDSGIVRGGSLSAGGGGPWGTGGLTSDFPGPCNAVGAPPAIVNPSTDYPDNAYPPAPPPDVYFEGWAPPSAPFEGQSGGAAFDPEGTADAGRDSAPAGANSDPEGTADAGRDSGDNGFGEASSPDYGYSPG
jgi:hypothetical protein